MSLVDNQLTEYLEKITLDNWYTKVNKEWTVHDVLAHLIGWVEIDIASLQRIWETKKLPWREKDFDVNHYNKKVVEKYSSTSPEQLLQRWRDVLKEREKQIELVGRKKIESDKDLFYWLFEDGNSGHTYKHYKQIRICIGK